MAVIQTELAVEMENGGTYEVTADQRDYSAWEMQDFYADHRANLRVRFLAYNALKRTKQIKSSWLTFNSEALEVTVKQSDAGEDVDPTNQDLSDED